MVDGEHGDFAVSQAGKITYTVASSLPTVH
jgi:VCBS repeat-containing protein